MNFSYLPKREKAIQLPFGKGHVAPYEKSREQVKDHYFDPLRVI